MRKTIRRICSLVGSLILMFCMCFSLVGCGDKEKKYDVSIKIRNSEGSTWIFTPDVDELKYEFEYTGEEMRFWIDSWNLPDHPRWKNEWFAPNTSGANVFHKSMLYTAPGEKRQVWRGSVKERGEYIILCEADSTSDLWYFRAVYLYVTIK